MKLGDLIRDYREQHDLSQRQFAVICGLSNGYISMLERGENPKTHKPVTPTLPQLKKLADGMGTTIMDVLDTVEDMPIDLTTGAMMLTGKKTPTPTNEGGRMDALDVEIATLILQLSPEKEREAVNYLRYLLARKDT